MFEDKFTKNLKEGEEIVSIVKKYPIVLFWPIFFSTAFIIAPFFFLYPLFHWGGWGVLIFFGFLGVGVLLLLRVFVVYSFNVFVITNQRIIDIDQRGFFDKTVSETTYEKIQDVSFTIKGIIQTIWHFGSIVIQTAGSQANIELHGIKDPEKVQHIITEIQKENRKDEEVSAAQIVEALRSIQSESATGNKTDNQEEE